MNPQVTDPNYKPIQFTASQLRERYERKRQQEEYVLKQNRAHLEFKRQCLKALTHESNLVETTPEYNYNHD